MATPPKATEAEAPVDLTDASLLGDEVDRDLMAMVEATDPRHQPDRPVDPAPEKPSPRVDAAPAPARKRGGGGTLFLGFVMGAAVAAAAGVGTLRYAPQFLAVPMAPQAGSAGDQALADLQVQVKALSDRVAALPAPDPALADRVAALESAAPVDTADLVARLDALSARIDALPATTGSGPASADLQALRDQIAALQSGTVASDKAIALATEAEARLAEARDAAAALKAATDEATAAAQRQAAFGRLTAALESGAPYGAALQAIGGAVPPVLTDNADTGIPALSALQATFPDAARRALEAAIKADMGATWTQRVGNFLRAQTAIRSLEPREGADPDAILSRAEAALAAGDIPGALAEISALPESARAAMADWTATADLRQQALSAAAALQSQG